MKKLVIPELANKLFIRKTKVNIGSKISQNFKVESTRDFLLIKNLISLELFAGKRPMIIASFLKKSLIITLRITNNKLPEMLPLIQKSPVMWKSYLSQINLFEKGFFTQLTNKNYLISFNKFSKLDNWIKSAYLD